MVRKCKYHGNGCTATASKDALLRHQADCRFRLVRCPVSICDNRFLINKV